MPMYPDKMDVTAPSTKAPVVKAPSTQDPCPTPTSRNTTTPKSTMKMQQMVYSADRKASAPCRIAS